MVAPAQQFVFDIVQVAGRAEELKEVPLPGRAEQAAQVLDGIDGGIGVPYQFQGQGVIGIDQKGDLAVSRPVFEGFPGHGPDPPQVAIQCRGPALEQIVAHQAARALAQDHGGQDPVEIPLALVEGPGLWQ